MGLPTIQVDPSLIDWREPVLDAGMTMVLAKLPTVSEMRRETLYHVCVDAVRLRLLEIRHLDSPEVTLVLLPSEERGGDREARRLFDLILAAQEAASTDRKEEH